MQDNAKTAFCIEFGTHNTFVVKSAREETNVHGIAFNYLEHTAYCSVCGSELYVPIINDMNVQARENAYAEKNK